MPSAGWKGGGQRELVFDGVDSAPVRHPPEMPLEALDDEGEAYRYLPLLLSSLELSDTKVYEPQI